MPGFVGGLIGFVIGLATGIVMMSILIVGKKGDVHSASPIADEGGKENDTPIENKK